MRETALRFASAALALATAPAAIEGATPHTVVWRRGPARLLHYPAAPGPAAAAAAAAGPPAPPLLLVTPFINRFRIVDLDRGVSLVERLAERGISVFVVDWGDPAPIDRRLDFEDYVQDLLPRAVAATGAPRIDLLGYCLGGTLAAMFAARFPGLVRRLVTLNAPIDFEASGLLSLFTDARYFPVEKLVGAFGHMPRSLVQQGFLWLRPVAAATKAAKAWSRFADADFARFFSRLESWNQDGVDIPGAVYRRLITDLYRENLLAKGRFLLGGTPVDLRAIEAPLLVIAAREDHIAPPRTARAIIDLVGSREKTYIEIPGGHIGAVVGPEARARLHDPLADWLLA